ncbi:MAG: AmmeMemoRadiSam system protein A [Lachnospiraceae bacterium]|nr:AmmeMemoRadiSam system protein A [Lachnospiraceae bacterium]
MSVIAAFVVPHPPMIIPAVGRGSEDQVKLTTASYQKVAKRIAELRPDTIVISSPHSVLYSDYFHISPGKRAGGSFAEFGAPGVTFDVTYDTDFVNALSEEAARTGFPAGTMGEKSKNLDHGTMVPLKFILKEYTDFKLVRTGLSGFDLLKHYEYGMMIKRVADALGKRVVFVASGDLSHKLQNYGPYGFAPEGPEYDRRIMETLGSGNFGELFDFDETFCDKAAECGHRSFVIMAGALDGQSLEIEKLSHEDVTGVGYGICTFEVKGEDKDRHFLAQRIRLEEDILNKKKEASDAYVKLARESAEYFVNNGRKMDVPTWVPQELLNEKAGAFVSIHKFGRLRGCIGTILPTTGSLAEEIIRNAVSAVSEDNRFDPVEEEELPWLDINVDVLTPPERISSESELDVKKYGVIVECGYKRGLLLPDLDGVDTVEQQISIAMRKGHIAPGSSIDLYRFEVKRHY